MMPSSHEASPFASVPTQLLIVGFVGHRVLPADVDTAALSNHLGEVLQELISSSPHPIVARCGVGGTSDLLFLDACRKLNVPYALVLTRLPERLDSLFTQPTDRDRATQMVNAAHSVEIAPGSEIDDALDHIVSREILDVADCMVCIWDGVDSARLGSTNETVRESRERESPIRILNSTTGELLPWDGNPIGDPPPVARGKTDALPIAADVPTLFKRLDERASAAAPRSRWFSAGSISLHQAASLVYAILAGLSLNMESARSVKFMIISTAAFLPLIGKRMRLRDTWTENRRRAELLRSLIASRAFSPPLRPFGGELFSADLPFLRAAGWHLAQQSIPWEQARDTYLSSRLDDQIGYLKRAGERAQARLRRLELCFRISAYSATSLSALAIVLKLLDWPLPTIPHAVFLRFLPIALPAIAAWCMAMISVFEHKRRARLYTRIAEQLVSLRKRLQFARTYTTAASIVEVCERLLLTELWEWGSKPGK